MWVWLSVNDKDVTGAETATMRALHQLQTQKSIWDICWLYFWLISGHLLFITLIRILFKTTWSSSCVCVNILDFSDIPCLLAVELRLRASPEAASMWMMNYFLSQVWAVLMGHCALPLSTWRKIGEHVLWKATGSIDQFKVVFCHRCDRAPCSIRVICLLLIFAASTCRERRVMCAELCLLGRPESP